MCNGQRSCLPKNVLLYLPEESFDLHNVFWTHELKMFQSFSSWKNSNVPDIRKKKKKLAKIG